MKFDVLNHASGKAQFTADINWEANTPRSWKLRLAVQWAIKTKADLSGANLSWADLSWANLSEANLSGANLTWANLSGANLSEADLSEADLSEADLSEANLTWANLSGAHLSRANLSGADPSEADLSEADLSEAEKSVLKIENIDAKILASIKGGGTLDMSVWHTCKTTHCRAGWAITLAGAAGRKLERAYGSNVAGAIIYAKSRPCMSIPDFFATNEDALADIRESAADTGKDGGR